MCPLPQQTTEPSSRTPHEWNPPADTAVNEPDGGVACAFLLEPQQATEPSSRTPHECSPPVDTAVNEPDGGVVTKPSTQPNRRYQAHTNATPR